MHADGAHRPARRADALGEVPHQVGSSRRRARALRGVTEAKGCAELERHCLRLRFAEEFHDQCQGVLVAQQLEEMVENELAAAKAREEAEKEEDVDVVALVNAVRRRPQREVWPSHGGGRGGDRSHASPQQMEVLAEKLDAVIVNVTAR